MKINTMITIIMMIEAVMGAKPASETRECVIECAREQFGKPYVLATEGPDTFDCSGLVMYCYEKCGYEFSIRPHTYELIYMGIEVSQSNLVLADLVFPSSGHVQLYSGDGNIIHAPHSGSYVKEQSMYGFWAGRRLIGVDDNNDNDNDDTSQQTGKRVTITASTLSVRSSPSTSSEAVATYYSGETAPFDSVVSSEECNWLSYIGGSGNRRYICSRTATGSCYTAPCAIGGKGESTTKTAMNVRATTSTSSTVLAYLEEGDKVSYDIVFSNDGRTWVSWLDGSTRKYIVAKAQDGTEYISPCP